MELKISYNPYDKEFKYFYRSAEGKPWIIPGPSSPLRNREFVKGQLQYIADSVIETINEKYNQENLGLTIYFEGTDEDYDALNSSLNYFLEEEKTDNSKEWNICLKKGKQYIFSADYVLKEINDIYDRMKSTLSVSGSDAEKEINRFKDISRPEIPICIMGLYSAGKSAFINSLIGKEILPSASDPTTAKNYRIKNSEGAARIKFTFEGRQGQLEFEGRIMKVIDDPGKTILKEIQAIVTGQLEQEENVYRVLDMLNDYDSIHGTKAVSELIEIEVPFVRTELDFEHFEFIFYDTPGSNSSSNFEHTKVLKSVLEKQTNGLPILVTTPDTMDQKDNRELLDIFQKSGQALDDTNTMIVINKSDDKVPEELEEKKKNLKRLKITEWKNSRIYFMSAVMGLGSKKKMCADIHWIDKNYENLFEKNIDDFLDENEKYFKELYKYDIIPDIRREELSHNEKNILPTEAAVLYRNSGLEFVEKEINDFAKKYAVYNKCSQARICLQKAIDITEDGIKKTEKKLWKLRQDKEEEKRVKIESVSGEIIGIVNARKQRYANTYPQKMAEYVDKWNEKIKKKSLSLVDTKYSDLQKQYKKDKKAAFNRFLEYANRENEKDCLDAAEEQEEQSRQFFEIWQDGTKDLCMKAVKENERLTQEEKEEVQRFITDIEPLYFNKVECNIEEKDVKGWIFWGRGISKKKFVKSYEDNFNQTLSMLNGLIIKEHSDEFERWSQYFQKEVTGKIRSMNPSVKKLDSEIQNAENKIIFHEKEREILAEKENEITNLLDYQKREEDA